jgi:hypothetical protein
MNDARLMNPDGTCALCGHMATEHTQGCSECDCELVAEAAKEPKDNEGIGHTIDVRFGLRLRRP